MSSRARRLTLAGNAAVATATPIASWLEAIGAGDVPASGRRAAQRVAAPGAPIMPALAGAAPAASAPVTQEQEIYAKGFAQGERAGAAAAQQETAALAKKLAASLDDLMRVRNEMIRHTEKQMVQLALAVARRVIHREVSIDASVLMTMMRVALERVSDAARVTVRLHPLDHQSVTAALADSPTSDQVTLTADSRQPRGGCRVESEYGDIDAGVDAQIQEIARALLGGDGATRS
jgi:flagellar assembly protein FliH